MQKMYNVFTVALFVLAVLAFSSSSGEAAKIKPKGTVNFELVAVRTLEAMDRDDAVILASGKTVESPIVPFKPTMNIDDYKALKDAANAKARITADMQGETSAQGTFSPPGYVGPDINGVTQSEAGGTRPPDTHGAVGPDHFAEITNAHYDVYRKSDGVRVKSVSLASFFGYSTRGFYDPRCIYDPTGNRWVVAAPARMESSTVQYQFVAVSKTTDPTGEFYIYRADLCFQDNNDFWDFPQVGVDSQSIFITALIFANNENYVGSDLCVVSKTSLYSGESASGKIFTGLDGPLAPPIVLDTNKKSCFVATSYFTQIVMYTLTYVKKSPILTKSAIPITAYSLPPNASQPGTATLLDTLDGRFVNASTQSGNSLWQVHTVNINDRPTPQWYEFNILKKNVTQGGTFTASSTSHDWNATIAANKKGDVFVTWSSTDVTAGTNAQVRYSGRRKADTSGIIDGGAALFTSSTYYAPTGGSYERWGDYSAVTIDPSNTSRAWIVNEKIDSISQWGSRITCIGY